jgi:hypothetical protein
MAALLVARPFQAQLLLTVGCSAANVQGTFAVVTEMFYSHRTTTTLENRRDTRKLLLILLSFHFRFKQETMFTDPPHAPSPPQNESARLRV